MAITIFCIVFTAKLKKHAKKSKGLHRDELIKLSGLPNAGSTTRLLDELEESGFIRKYIPFGKKSRNSLYQLVDFYTHFYLKFIANTQLMNKNNWLNEFRSGKLIFLKKQLFIM
ncbi:MAG: hypothetical protein K8S16_12110 [Bacteroidales bacterium]|nr:hypothetical protein [Bacteroidales bacterium]